jgi:hypothetical protein
MALPFNQLDPVNQEILNNLRAQSEALKAQTSVLHKLSDEILKQRRETSGIGKTVGDLQRQMFGMGNISGMKDLFGSKSKLGTGMATAVGSRNAQPDRGFFTNLFNKIFGPSKYQTKLMEEMTLLRELTERQSKNIEFMAEQSTDSKRARERELLAEAIARKIAALGLDGDSGGMGSIVSTLGKALIAGIGGAIALLARSISTALTGLLAGIKLAFSGLEKLFNNLFSGGFPRGPIITGGPGGGGGVPPPGGAGGRGGPAGVPLPPPGSPNSSGRIPPDRQLPNNQRGAPYKPGWNPRYGPQVQDVPYRPVPGEATGGRFSPGAGRSAIAAALVALAGALGYKAIVEDEAKEAGARMGGSVFNENSTQDLLDNIRSEIEMKRQGVKPRNLAPGEALDMIGNRLIDDPGVPGRKITAEQYKRLYGKSLTKEQTVELDKYIQEDKIQKAEDELAKKQREKLEQEEKQINFLEDFNEVLNKGIDSLDGLAESLAGISKNVLQEKLVPFLNRLGEVTIQGQTINLAPELGTAISETLKDTYKLSEELVDYTKEKFSGPSTVIQNNNVIDNSNKGGSGNSYIPQAPNNSDSATQKYFDRFFNRQK